MFDSSASLQRIPAPSGNRWLAVLLGLIAIGGLAGGIVGREVLVDEWGDGAMKCGLRECQSCWNEECFTTSTIDLVDDMQRGRARATPAWGWSGTIGWWAAIVAAAGILLACGMVASRRYFRLPVSPTTIILVGGAVALIAGCVFVATKPENVGVTRVGWTFWSFGGGVIVGVVSAFLLARQLARIEPEFDPGESVPGAADEPWHDDL